MLAVPVLLSVPVGTVALWVGLRTGDPAQVEVLPALPAIGPRTPITVKLKESRRGLVAVEIDLVQGGTVTRLDARSYVAQRAWAPWDPKVNEAELQVVVGKAVQPLLMPGEAEIRVTAHRASTWMRSPAPTVHRHPMQVQLQAPKVRILSFNTFVAQGGSEAVVYQLEREVAKEGVRAGRWWFPGYPLPGGGPLDRFVLFAAPYDQDDAKGIRLVVADDLGNEAQLEFIDKFKPRPFRNDTIPVSDKLMNTVVPAISAQTAGFRDRGNLVANYVAINSEVRRENNARLEALVERTQRRFLWDQVFVSMQAKVISRFADRRSYMYNGVEIDRQDHLGLDLASTQKAPVPATNDGVVLLAEYLGIYGNCVVIDHGYGLMSLYAHLSTVDVRVGESVKRAQVVGRTGTTGMALGDHLHFTLMLHGLPVTPIEWWDAHWIRDRLSLKLGDALPFTE